MVTINSATSDADIIEIKSVAGCDRWIVYHRLQELGISCQCSPDKPLKVHVNHPLTGIQLWSVIKQTTASRPILLQWLHQCWGLSTENR